MDKKIKILYILCLLDEDKILDTLAYDRKALSEYVGLCLNMPPGFLDANQVAKKIAAQLKPIKAE